MKETFDIVSHWDETWSLEQSRRDWLTPDSRVTEIIPFLKARNVRKVLDVGCGVGRHALMAEKR